MTLNAQFNVNCDFRKTARLTYVASFRVYYKTLNGDRPIQSRAKM